MKTILLLICETLLLCAIGCQPATPEMAEVEPTRTEWISLSTGSMISSFELKVDGESYIVIYSANGVAMCPKIKSE